MGCVHAKCCSQYPNSSNGDTEDINGVGIHDKSPQANGNHLCGKSIDSVHVPSHNYHLEYTYLTQRGFYPDSPDKENQDSVCIRTNLQDNPNLHFFGVFDGHGQFGTECSNFVKDRLVEILSNDPTLSEDPVKAYNSAFLATNSELHASEIDDNMSGTTAITVLVIGDTLFTANVGDSRAVIAVADGDRVLAENLSWDQTPFRTDECERVKLCGARVMTLDQVQGLQDPNIQSWGDEIECGDPPRLWVQGGMYPGTAFSRSVGDSVAEEIGVIAVPEVSMVQLTPSHLFFVIASDGVFEFLSSQAVVDMTTEDPGAASICCGILNFFKIFNRTSNGVVVSYADPREACAGIAEESYKLWLEHENRTDDISIIVVGIKNLHNV